MLNVNNLKTKLNSGKVVLGTWSIIDSPTVVDIIASTNIDFIIIDAEHGPVSYETAQQMVSICEAQQVTPIMRVGKIDESLILRSLDIGMHGIQLPNITTANDVKMFVEYAKYPPIGNRGFSPYTKAGQYDVNNGTILTEKANQNIILIANVEGIEGINNIAEISANPHIDVIFIGLFDLSKSLSIAGQVEHPRVIEKLRNVISIIKSNGKFVGSIASNTSMMKILLEMEIDYLTFSVDSGMLKDAYEKIVDNFKNNI